ncbi:MAG: hypothetical protein AVDCRST_MAG85-738 [uncultured Solirubrobacteraceae bacterium]|uniref:Uncharacterized protein n=1 Tax=uncultured Solirubrobacteraceae bacterium TaxID=1162706 RepID=A0A6J4S0I0_9ACTN|nr:MAG: hypothetical protein AVDCRST_MAG85-738 [uncultured Solirubrobacteraceae bacterium]
MADLLPRRPGHRSRDEDGCPRQRKRSPDEYERERREVRTGFAASALAIPVEVREQECERPWDEQDGQVRISASLTALVRALDAPEQPVEDASGAQSDTLSIVTVKTSGPARTGV